jgi:NAD(P)-dependent dehydrogenase (short-subunit alcohol dehydrogenase family)
MGRGLLKDRVAIITGAGQGLGEAIARELADEGAALGLIEINPETLGKVKAELEVKGHPILAFPMSVTDYDAYARAIAQIVEKWGHLDILVNNAATCTYATILEDNLEDWRRQIAVDLEAYYMGAKLSAPYMVRQKFGRIISITSVQGFAASGTCGAYCSSKGGIIALTKSMAVELAPYNIMVNAIAPGTIHTPMSIMDGVDEVTTDVFLNYYVGLRKIPVGRAGEPEDVAGTVVFLASDYCRYMTGEVLVVDGGLTSTF